MKNLFIESENFKIAFAYEQCDNCANAIIILHGLAEHKGRYIDFMNKLCKFGITSFALDLRGHGESSGNRGDIDNFATYLNDLSLFINFIIENFGVKKIILFGHSLGGQIVAAYSMSSLRAKEVEAVILSSPAIAFGFLPVLFHFIPYKLCGNVKIKKRHSESKEMLVYSRNDPLACRDYSIRLLGIMFIDGKKQARKSLEKIELPTLILCGDKDPLIKSKKLNKFLNKVKNKNVSLKTYPNVKHRIVQNEGCEERIQDIINWIKKLG